MESQQVCIETAALPMLIHGPTDDILPRACIQSRLCLLPTPCNPQFRSRKLEVAQGDPHIDFLQADLARHLVVAGSALEEKMKDLPALIADDYARAADSKPMGRSLPIPGLDCRPPHFLS